MHLVQDFTLTHTAEFPLTHSAVHSNSICIFKAKIPGPPFSLERVYASFHCGAVYRSLPTLPCFTFSLEILNMLAVFNALGFIVIQEISNKVFWVSRKNVLYQSVENATLT
jgi:hypothetical protein